MAWPSFVRAEGGALVGEESRAAALGGAMTARPGELSSMFFNPGALADIEEPMFTLSGQVGRLQLWHARTGEPRIESARTLTGIGLAVGSPLPGPAWLQAVHVGISFYVPAQHALKIEAPSRVDEPTYALYGSRLEHAGLMMGLAVDIVSRVSVGASILLTPQLIAPTRVSLDASRGETLQDNIVVDLDRQLETRAVALAGIRVQVIDALSVGFTFRQAAATRAVGPNDIEAGTITVNDDIDFFAFWSPRELAIGVAAEPGADLSLSADVIHAAWSEYRTIHNEALRTPFDDIWVVRAGVEWSGIAGLALRTGYSFEPTPVPTQSGDLNLLDADRHVLALGAGLDLREMVDVDVALDVHVRTHLLGTQRDEKVDDQLTDADLDAAGRQIDNLGYPGISSSGSFWQGGLTLTFFLGPDEEAP